MDKRVLTIIIFIFISVFTLSVLAPLLPPFEISNPFDYARITDVEYKAVVQDEADNGGSILITERLTFDIHAASQNNPFWELWRTLPEEYSEDLSVDYKVHSVKQILPDGSEVIWEEAPKLYWEDYDYDSANKVCGPNKWYHSKGPYNPDQRRYECLMLYVDGIYREEMVFEIVYELEKASLQYADCSEIYVSLFSGKEVNYLNSFKGEILFPQKDMPAPGNYKATTYGTDRYHFPFEESDTKYPGFHTFSFALDKKDLVFHNYNQFIEFELYSFGNDKHIFTENAPEHYYSDYDALAEILVEQEEYDYLPNEHKFMRLQVLIFSLFLSFLVLIYVFTAPKRLKSKYTFYKTQQEYDFFREIPSDLDPALAAAILNAKNHKKTKYDAVYSAVLLSLARKGYVKLEDRGSDYVRIIVTRTPPAIKSSVKESPSTLLERLSQEGPLMRESYAGTPNAAGTLPVQQAPTMPDQTPSENLEPLTYSEELYLSLIMRHATNNMIFLQTLQEKMEDDYNYTQTFFEKMATNPAQLGVKQGYFQNAYYKMPMSEFDKPRRSFAIFSVFTLIFYLVMMNNSPVIHAYCGPLILILSLVFGIYYLGNITKKKALLTQAGENEYAKWVGLYNFLNNDTLLNERTHVELPIWEKYLVYATAFGISEKVIQAIEIRCPKVLTAPESPILSNTAYRPVRFSHIGRSFHSSVHRSVSRASYSSSLSSGGFGSGGFGGYGGGGRGGGGGGGGH